MSRALVLGGGGPVGIAWEAGLLVGFEEQGVSLTGADAIVGTSAGSVVGAWAATGGRLEEALALLQARDDAADVDPGALAAGMASLFEAMTRLATWTGTEEEGRTLLGKVALTGETMPEERFLSRFADLAGRAWPSCFACTAVHAETGAFVVWDEAAGVPLERAVASSCAVPGVYPPVVIDGAPYMDGGMRNALNAQVAAGHERVAVLSCMALELPEGLSDPMFTKMAAAVEADFAAVRAAGGELALVAPSTAFLELSGFGLHLMDSARALDAYELGRSHARDEAERVGRVWARRVGPGSVS
jgi:NTE family protein